MPGDRLDRQRGEAPAEPAWHERTGTLAGASVAALLAIALLYFLISSVARQFNEPDPAPGYYLDPGGTSSSHRTSRTSSTTTTTISTINPPITSDINPGDTTTTSPSTPSDTDTAATTTEPSQLYPPQTRSGTTTRSRPRLNQTRTVYPPP